MGEHRLTLGESNIVEVENGDARQNAERRQPSHVGRTEKLVLGQAASDHQLNDEQAAHPENQDQGHAHAGPYPLLDWPRW